MVQAKGLYKVAGYSFGAAVAFEIVVDLERRGDKAELIFIDGSPTVMLISQKLEMSNDNEAAGLSAFAFVCGKFDYMHIYNKLITLPKLEDRLDFITKLVAPSIKQPSELVRA